MGYIRTSLIVVCVIMLGVSYAHAVDNILANGGFEDGVMDPWGIYGDAVGEIASGDAAEGQFYLHITTPLGANFWDAGLQHGGHVFEAGKAYTLAAFLRSPDNAQINFKPELAADPWTGYGSQQFTMTNTWEEYYINTGMLAENVDPGSITFHIAYAVAQFDIDGVRFYEGDYVEPAAVKPAGKVATLWGKLKAE
jgi:hypothetical protein